MFKRIFTMVVIVAFSWELQSASGASTSTRSPEITTEPTTSLNSSTTELTETNTTEILFTQTTNDTATTESGQFTADPGQSTPNNTADTDMTTTPTISFGDFTTTPGGGDCGHGQHFDAASFVGGMVLCGGVVAISLFGYKFYTSRKESRYHQF